MVYEATNKLTNDAGKEAIAESIMQNSIPTIDFTSAAYGTLMMECDDSVEANGITEFWGTDEDGNAWRVHMHGTGY